MENKNRKLEVNRNGKFYYSIWLEPDFVRLPAALEELQVSDRKLCVVTDTSVAELYGE